MTDTELSATAGNGPPPMPAGLADEQFAANVREERERKGLSQADVADRMRERGWSWHPQTVQKIEAGHRKVSVGEGEALGRIFGTTIDRLTWPGRVASATALLDMTIARAERAFKDISRATGTLLWCHRQLETTVSEAERDGYLGSDTIRQLADEARHWIAVMPEVAVLEARQRHEGLYDDGDEEEEEEEEEEDEEDEEDETASG